MSEVQVVYSQAAVKDLETIWNYSRSQWSADQADRYYLELTEQITLLSSNPHLGKTADSVRPGFRVLAVQAHHVYYRAEPNAQVEVVRILHQQMSLTRWFGI